MRRAGDQMTNGDGRAGGGVRGAHRDQRGLVAGFVVRTLFVFVILIVCVEEAGQIVLAQTHASNAAGTSAQAAADDFYHSKNANHAEAIAVAVMAAQDPKATMTSFSVGADGSVTVSASEPAATFLVQHLPFVKKYWVQEATVTQIHTLA